LIGRAHGTTGRIRIPLGFSMPTAFLL